MRPTFKEVLAGPIPEAWLALLRRLDGEELVNEKQKPKLQPVTRAINRSPPTH
jgi:hypothetical protein